MTINYTEKGYGLWQALTAADLPLYNIDGVFYTNPKNKLDTTRDVEVQAFINAYDPLPYAKKLKIAALKVEGVARAQAVFEGIKDFGDLDLVSQIVQSIAPASRSLTARITTLSQIWTAGKNAVDAVNAATTVAAVNAVTPAWP
jgi:hypothetical protein